MFNWFVTINIGILGFLFSNHNTVLNSFYIYLIGLLLNILWLYIGINDYLSMEKKDSRGLLPRIVEYLLFKFKAFSKFLMDSS